MVCVAAWTASAGFTADDVRAALDAYRRGEFETAYQILLPVATSDNPRIQNWVGVLTYMGRGTEADAIAAHDLFHSAADSGVEDARHNLGILHSIGADGVPVDYAEARAWFTISAAYGHEDSAPPDASAPGLPRGVTTVIDDELEATPLGQYTYSVFCAGCHGFNGMHVFPHAPSFSMGERMIKSDEELLESIVDGKGMMPAWGNKLPRSHLLAALQFLRELSLRTGYGTRSTSWSDVSD